MSQTIFVLTGLPGSGKSTITDRILRTCSDFVVVCKDSLRTSLNGGRYVFDPTKETFIHSCAQALVHLAVDEGLNIIIDETNTTSLNRVGWVEFVQLYPGLTVKCLWCTETARNAEYRMVQPRGFEKDYWQKVIDKMKGRFEAPTSSEGFDDIIQISDPNTFELDQILPEGTAV
jgi:predicted kinase